MANAKSRSFSIYLLKEGFDATNTLEDEHALQDDIAANNLPEGATLYLLDNVPRPPWWKGYFDVQQSLTQALKGAIVFLPVGERCFAITFGHVFHNLKDASYEYDFGLRITLNSVEPDQLKSLDGLEPGLARRQRIQLPVGSDLVGFDFDSDSTVLKSLTGRVKDAIDAPFKHVTGSSSVRVSSSAQPNELPELCEYLLGKYKDTSFKTAFPDILNVTPVRDPVIIDSLNAELLEAIQNKDENLILAIPEIIDYRDEMYATFTGARAGLVYDDIFIDRYYDYLEGAKIGLDTINIEMLKKHRLVLTNEDGQPRGDKASILKSMIYDTSLDGMDGAFHISEGNWYQVDSNYITELSTYLDPLCKDTALPDFNHANEGEFNDAGAAASTDRVCMDKKSIAPKGQRQVEPCDIYETQDGTALLHHVKRSIVSATLSHLFNQGLNSIELVRDNEEAREKLKALAAELSPDGQLDTFTAPIDNNAFKVIYQIVTHKDKEGKSRNLPLFSRISLKRTMKSLRRMGIPAEFCFVNDLSPKTTGKKKKWKKPEKKKNLSEITPEEAEELANSLDTIVLGNEEAA
ncbi:MAG: DUF6119 family protein [Robiginitomaculum sp.]